MTAVSARARNFFFIAEISFSRLIAGKLQKAALSEEQSRLPYGVRSTGRRTFTGCSAYDNIGPHSGPGSHKIERTPPQCGTLLQTKPWKSSLLPTGLCTFTPYCFKQAKSMVNLYKISGKCFRGRRFPKKQSRPAASSAESAGRRGHALLSPTGRRAWE